MDAAALLETEQGVIEQALGSEAWRRKIGRIYLVRLNELHSVHAEGGQGRHDA